MLFINREQLFYFIRIDLVNSKRNVVGVIFSVEFGDFHMVTGYNFETVTNSCKKLVCRHKAIRY